MPSSTQLSRRGFLVSALAAGSAYALGADKPSGRRPNIVFILADDMGYGDPAVYGQTKIRTPNIDRMAAGGMRFTQGYAGAPVCAPSRCTLMTGMHGGHARVRDNFALAAGHVGHKKKEEIRRASLTTEDRTVADYLRGAGYRTGLMGKWHLDGYDPDAVPTKHGFEEFKGWLTQIDETQGYWPEKRMHGETLIDIPENAGGKQGRYDTTMITEDSVDYIERHKADPFFLYVAYDSPHSPYTAPDFGPYKDHPTWADDEKTYAAMIWYMDLGIGKILDTLKRLKLDEDTVVFFASDNGPRSEPTVQQTRVIDFFDSNGNLTGYKRDMYEGGIRDPLIARWPGHIPAGAVNQMSAYFPDFLPTALDLAGAPVEKGDGISLRPYLMNPKLTGEERFLYWEFYEPVFRQAARLGRWKAVRLKRGGKLELYDLSVDAWESKDVAVDHPEIVAKMEAGMAREHRASAEYPDPGKGAVAAPNIP
ncbi:arylsulfatase [Granulicella tundricola]|uniref:Sulfatase n=1 Tax=Granulicella tundricola (strain ATCC BAA-1859 / DSM 23138 / MP5ACTX9) TaxID=1198114 RepID=E8X4E4_GRATM|nr:arylsulfatase [Granulicella tundricola]ADW68271.1 sulfatase [Granulicella tundricola MP5ACTX9]